MAYRDAPVEDVWLPPIGLMHLSLAIMPFACLLVVAGMSTPNPSAVGGDTPEVLDRGADGHSRGDPPSGDVGHRAVGHRPSAGQRRCGESDPVRRHDAPGAGRRRCPGDQEAGSVGPPLGRLCRPRPPTCRSRRSPPAAPGCGWARSAGGAWPRRSRSTRCCSSSIPGCSASRRCRFRFGKRGCGERSRLPGDRHRRRRSSAPRRSSTRTA